MSLILISEESDEQELAILQLLPCAIKAVDLKKTGKPQVKRRKTESDEDKAKKTERETFLLIVDVSTMNLCFRLYQMHSPLIMNFMFSAFFFNYFFFIVLQTEHDFQLAIKEKNAVNSSNNLNYPYLAIVGPNAASKKIYCVIREIIYQFDSVPAALECALKIFVTFDFKYPKQTCHVWQYFQKSFL